MDDRKEIDALLDRIRHRAHRSARAQYIASKRAGLMHNILGIPVVILSVVVGTTLFSSLGSDPRKGVVICAGIVSLLASVLAALQTFLGYSESKERHFAAATSLSALKRELDLLALRFRVDQMEPPQALDLLAPFVDRFSTLIRDSPDVPDRYYDRARAEEEEDSEGV
ncbi:SLATT domain-containing protein [Nocardia gipuzkoensis]|uniref:SLATT domain-containing protein n=1 Tax=Nocardia gipuzkoensis TaxID=2749991 RepID=UPI001E2FCD3D|nr:SLATT domain-containing protein [Nocardia gipuzkoensis]UGT71565.1 SLATT domain-containing protein [Nocardia gipuzkoensis]